MAEISKVVAFMIDQFNTESNTITTNSTKSIDSNIENIYPLVNIDLIESEVDGQIIILSFKITIVQQRDTRNVTYSEKVFGGNNLIDNLNETHFIASRFIAVLENNNNDDNIELVSKSKIAFLKGENRSNLDGVQFDLEISIPNESYSC